MAALRQRLLPTVGSYCLGLVLAMSSLSLAQPAGDGPAAAPTTPRFFDKALPIEQRVADLLGQMTLQEKILMTGGQDKFYLTSIPRLKLPPVYLSDASGGINHRPEIKPMVRTTAFPSTITLAATWRPELSHAMGEALAIECRANGVSILLGPGVNVYRTSTCGRNFEYLGEDPHVISRHAVAYIRGMQAQGIIAVVKHYMANNHEFVRNSTDVQLSDRAIHEIYLPAFKAAVQEAKVHAVMTSFPWVNGEKMGNSRRYIQELLRDQVGHQGLVMTDWHGYEHPQQVLDSGLDLMMPNNNRFAKYIQAELAKNPEKAPEIEAKLDRMLRRLFTTLLSAGVYDRPEADPALLEQVADHKEITRRIGEEGITLLKNQDGVLPIGPNVQRILVVGDDYDRFCGDGSGRSTGYDHVKYEDGLRAVFGDRITFESKPTDEQLKGADIVLHFVLQHGSEARDAAFELPAAQTQAVQRSVAANPNTVVVITGGRGLDMPWRDRAKGIVYAYYLGQERGNSLARVLSGAVTPSGKLPFTIEKRWEDSPAYGYNVVNGKPQWLSRFDLEKNNLPKPLPISYAEGIFVGYRWYEHKRIEPQFPFGHGLSYTTFEYADLATEETRVDGALRITAHVTVRNTGKVKGAEVVQLYVRETEPTVERPEKELKGFIKVDLAPGESKRIGIQISRDDLAYWDERSRAWEVRPGTYELLIGSSSADIRERKPFVYRP